MSQCIKPDCPASTVEPRPEGKGASVQGSQLYCAVHLKEQGKSGKWSPIQVPIPKNQ